MSSPDRLRKELGSLRITVGQIGVTKLAGDVRAGMIRRHELGLLSLELLPVSMVRDRGVAYKGERQTGMRGHLFGHDILSSPHNRCVHVLPNRVRLVSFGDLTPLPPALLEIIGAFTGDGSIGVLAQSCGALSQRLGAASKVAAVGAGAQGIEVSVKECRKGGKRAARSPAPTEAWSALRDKVVDGSASVADVAGVPHADLVAVDPLFGVQMLPLAISSGAGAEVVAAIAKGSASVHEGLRLAAKSHNTACVQAILDSGTANLAVNVLTSSSADEHGTPIVHAMGHLPTLRILIPFLQEASPAAIERIYAIAQRYRCDVACATVAAEWAPVLKRLPVRWWRSSGIVHDIIKYASTPTFKLLADACPAPVADQDFFGASVFHHAVMQLKDADAVAAVANEFPHHAWLSDRCGRAPLEVALSTRRKWTDASQMVLRTTFDFTKTASRPSRGHTLGQVCGIVTAALNARQCQCAAEVVRTFLPVIVADGTTPTADLADMACAACAAQDLETLELLVRHRPEVAWEKSPFFSSCALGTAVAKDCKAAAEFLLESGALIGNDLVALGHRPLDVALRCGPTETAKLIVGHPDALKSLASAVPAALEANTLPTVRLLGDVSKQWPAELVTEVLCTRADWCLDPDAWKAFGTATLQACTSATRRCSFVSDLFMCVGSWPKSSSEHRDAVLDTIVSYAGGAGDAWIGHREVFESALSGRRWAVYSHSTACALLDAGHVRLASVWRTQLYRAADVGADAAKAVLSSCFELATASFAVCSDEDDDVDGRPDVQTLVYAAVQVFAQFLWRGNWCDALSILQILAQQKDVPWPRVVLMPPVRGERKGVQPSTLWAWRTLGCLQGFTGARLFPHVAAAVIIRDSRIPTDAVSEFCQAALLGSSSTEAVLHCALACAATGIGCDRRPVMSVLPTVASDADDAELLRCLYPDELGFISSNTGARWLSCAPEVRVSTSLIAFRRNGRIVAPVDLPSRRVYTMPWVFKSSRGVYISADPENLRDPWPSNEKGWSYLVGCPSSHARKYSVLAATRGGSHSVLENLQQAHDAWGVEQRRAACVALAACDRETLDAFVANIGAKVAAEELLPFINALLCRADGLNAALKLAELARSDPELGGKMLRRAAVHRVGDDDFSRFVAATGCVKAVFAEPKVAVALASGKRTAALREVWADLNTNVAYRCLWRLAVAGDDTSADLVDHLAAPLPTAMSESVMMCCVQGSAYKILDACITRYGNGSAEGLRAALWCGGAGCPLATSFASFVTKHSAWSAALQLSGATLAENADDFDDDGCDPRDDFMGHLWRGKATAQGGCVPEQCELAVNFLQLAPLAATKSRAAGSAFHNGVISSIMCSTHPVPFAGSLTDHIIDHFSSGKGADMVNASVAALVRELIDAKSAAGMKCLRCCAVSLRGPAAVAFGTWAASLPTTTACMDALLRPAIASAHDSAAAVGAMLTTAKSRDLFDRQQHLVDVLLVAMGLNLPPLLDWLVSNSYTISSAVAAGEREETPVVIPAGLDAKYRKALVDDYDTLVDVPQRTLRHEFAGDAAKSCSSQATKDDVAAALRLPPKCNVGLTVASVAEGVTQASCFGMALPQKLDSLLSGTVTRALKTIDVTVCLGDASNVAYSWDNGCLGVTYTVASTIDAADRFFSAVNPDLPDVLTA